MANTMRWRYGDTNPVMLAVDSATEIEIGDLIYLDTDDAKPASSQADQGTEGANQDAFHDNFAGVAMQASAAGDTGLVRVATTGVFELECDAASFEVGDLLGAQESSDGATLEDQKVKGVAGAGSALGRCAARSNSSARVLIDIVSAVMKGGVQAVA